MIKQKNVFLFFSVMCLFALTGCMKLAINNGLSFSNDDNKMTNSQSTIQTDDTSIDNVTPTYFGEKSCMRYDQLNDTQKLVYNQIFDGIEKYSNVIDISHDINEDDLEKIYDAIINTADFELVYPTRKYDFKYDSISGSIYKISPKYDVSLDTRSNMISQVDTIVDSVIAETYGLDEFQTLKYFHDYIILNCSYDADEENCSNAYGVFIDGKAVCEGYARAFKYLCDKVGIPCELVIGNTDIEHMWNIVEIDGNWYHVDVTWDDPKNKDGDYISYSYFNLSDEQIFIDHTVNDTYTLPIANSLDMNYFNYYNLCVGSIEELSEVLYNQVYDACLNDNLYVYFKADCVDTYNQIISKLCNDHQLYDVIKSASFDADNVLNMNDISFSYDDDMLTFTINLKY